MNYDAFEHYWYPLPASNTLRFFDERGLRLAKVVTPRLLQVARNYFDCPTLNGVELENQPTTDGACWGHHFEERVMMQEVMYVRDAV
jgi:leishmanolysin-like peptidase